VRASSCWSSWRAICAAWTRTHTWGTSLAFDSSPRDAIGHYAAGVRIGELSLGPGFDGVLSWGCVDNRPFLRCLHGYGLSLWRLGDPDAARAVFERMLRQNPSDNQGARFLLDDLRRGARWEQLEGGEGAATSSSAHEDRRTLHAVPPAAREVPVDLDELASAIEDGNAEHAWYLDRETGALHVVFEGADEDDAPVTRDELEGNDRFALVTPEEPRVAYRDMVEFAATVRSAALRTRLDDALEGKGAFGRFRRVLADAPAERERWFEFRNARLRERAREWLAELGIEPRAR
jgi:hypothetical protein